MEAIFNQLQTGTDVPRAPSLSGLIEPAVEPISVQSVLLPVGHI